jgi:hypothetical protein
VICSSRLVVALALLAVASQLIACCNVSDDALPIVLIYSQGGMGYGNDLAEMIHSDPRVDARVIVLSDPELFKSMIYFPYVKVVVGVFNADKDEALGRHLINFFEGGGGVVGLGFAGWRSTTGNASRDVFSINGSYYLTGKYDPDTRTFVHRLVVGEENEINQGIGGFSARTQRIIMHVDEETGDLIPPWAEGQVTILYRESTRSAPALVLHSGKGVCVTFAGFTGDSIEGVPTYFGHFTGQDEFRQLFSNSVFHVWNEESRFDETVARWESESAEYESDLADIQEDIERASENRQLMLYLRYISSAVIAVVAIAIIYLYCFRAGRGDSVNG